jgi:predicted transport protein
MGDVNVFRFNGDNVTELEKSSLAVEKALQTLIEKNLEVFFGVRFLVSEYSTGKKHGGRIDTLGIDENGCPIIIEYKRAINENVINQGLFYLDWLMDHMAEFELMVLKHLGQQEANEIEWSSPRLLCIAGNFTKYDEYAVQQINRNIELIRYCKYGDDVFLFELVNASTAQTIDTEIGTLIKTIPEKPPYKTVDEYLAQSDENLRNLFDSLKTYLLALGDDVQQNTLKYYYAFKRFKNFACVEVHPQARKLIVFVKLNPESIGLIPSFMRDVRGIGHCGTGDLEITIESNDDLDKAKPFLQKSYEVS